MARYYLDKDLTITGVVPGSTVGVWFHPSFDEEVPDSRLLQDRDTQVFVGTINEDTLSIPVPPREGTIFIRIRKNTYKTFEMPFYLNGSDGNVHVRQQN